MIDFEQLYAVLSLSREASGQGRLSPLPVGFYADVAGYVRMMNEYIDNSSGRERDMLADEAKNAKILIEEIMCQRQSLVVKWAVVDAGQGTCREVDGMNPWERALYIEVLIAVDAYQVEVCRKVQKGVAPGEPKEHKK